MAFITLFSRTTFQNTIEFGKDVPIDWVHSSRLTGDIVCLSCQQNQIHVATVNGFVIGTVHPTSPDDIMASVCISSLDPGRNVNLIAVGCDYGVVR